MVDCSVAQPATLYVALKSVFVKVPKCERILSSVRHFETPDVSVDPSALNESNQCIMEICNRVVYVRYGVTQCSAFYPG